MSQLTDRRTPLDAEPLGEAPVQAADQRRAFVDERGVDLDQARARFEPLPQRALAATMRKTS